MLKPSCFFIGFAAFLLLVSPVSSSSHILINEFASDVASGEKEWVEFYNPGSADQSLSGWLIEERTGSDLSGVSSYSLDSLAVPASGFAVYEFSGSKLNNGGDILTLKNGSAKIDEIAYGSASNSQVAAPKKNQSAGRNQDGSPSWVIFDSFTKSASNNSGQAVLEPSPSPLLSPSPMATSVSSKSTLTTKSPSPQAQPPGQTAKTQSATVLGGKLESTATATPSASPASTPTPSPQGKTDKTKIAAALAGSGLFLIGLAIVAYLWYAKKFH